jgi:hypothetical protein
MKFEVVCYYILKAFCCFCGFVGSLGILGFVGSHERGIIDAAQFWTYELHAIGLIGLAYLTYKVTELIVVDLLRRARLMNRKGKSPRYSKQLRKASEDYDVYCSMYHN